MTEFTQLVLLLVAMNTSQAISHLSVLFPSQSEDYLRRQYRQCNYDLSATVLHIENNNRRREENTGGFLSRFLNGLAALCCCGDSSLSEDTNERSAGNTVNVCDHQRCNLEPVSAVRRGEESSRRLQQDQVRRNEAYARRLQQEQIRRDEVFARHLQEDRVRKDEAFARRLQEEEKHGKVMPFIKFLPATDTGRSWQSQSGPSTLRDFPQVHTERSSGNTVNVFDHQRRNFQPIETVRRGNEPSGRLHQDQVRRNEAYARRLQQEQIRRDEVFARHLQEDRVRKDEAFARRLQEEEKHGKVMPFIKFVPATDTGRSWQSQSGPSTLRDFPQVHTVAESIDESDASQRATFYRQEAQRHLQKRSELYQLAHYHLTRHNRAMANYYFQQAKKLTQLVEENNSRAAATFLAENTGGKKNTIDLHHLFVKEAIEALDGFLDDEILDLRVKNVQSRNLNVITGRGKHSTNGIPKIKPAVIKRIYERSLQYSEMNPGHLKVPILKDSCLTVEL